MIVDIFYTCYCSVQLYLIVKILQHFCTVRKEKSYEFLAVLSAGIINIVNIYRAILALFGLATSFVMFDLATRSFWFACSNAYLVIFWLGGVTYHIVKLRRYYKRQLRLKELNFRQ